MRQQETLYRVAEYQRGAGGRLQKVVTPWGSNKEKTRELAKSIAMTSQAAWIYIESSKYAKFERVACSQFARPERVALWEARDDAEPMHFMLDRRARSLRPTLGARTLG